MKRQLHAQPERLRPLVEVWDEQGAMRKHGRSKFEEV
jgi:hypothetical protein